MRFLKAFTSTKGRGNGGNTDFIILLPQANNEKALSILKTMFSFINFFKNKNIK